ncbi:phage tail tube protein [Chelatococcus asaccharovorans]|uniref:phage tail tube protein n=1 Tax=Chelatococcus asaccharovorans TaxID=28210 RepID=UPI00224C7290|nr:phage tail tube protein [Chelatococcus asaccharovorans]CAH1672062.1 conserved hypothetical protein [Chelatococcus asaccharovorans]CAH1676522.1 conserved hypothetical protein [Chelatococcus asaccharovorans]
MGYQSGRNILVAYKEETAYGELPTSMGAKVFRPNTGGLNLTKGTIQSNENRRDGMTTRARHGQRNLAGSYSGDLSLGSYDDLIAAVFRGTFDAPLALSGLSLTVDDVARTFTRSFGSWITDGVKVGDVVRFDDFTTVGNNDRNFRVTGVTATVLTVADEPVEVAVAETGVTLSRPKKVLQGLTPRSFAFEEYEADIDGSEVALGVRVGSMQLQLQPNGMAVLTFNFAGQNSDVLEGADAPHFTSPVATTSIGLTAVEAVIRIGDEDLVDLTSLDITVDLRAAGTEVVARTTTPDVFTNNATIEGNMTALRKDFTRVKNFLAEDVLSLHLLFAENEAEPKGFAAFYLGNLTLGSASKSELGADGPRTQTLSLNIGKDERGGAFDPTMIKFQTSAV